MAYEYNERNLEAYWPDLAQVAYWKAKAAHEARRAAYWKHQAETKQATA
ncbi:hypothetical protein ACFYLX_03660 [Pseudarthrobacter enclensis]